MHKHGSGRFGKYGDLKRKEKIWQVQRIHKGENLPSLHPSDPGARKLSRKPIGKK